MLLYIMKVVGISAALLALYGLLLRDKKWHHWSRLALLAGSVLSLVLPWVQLNLNIIISGSPVQQYREAGMRYLEPVLVQTGQLIPWWQQVNWIGVVYVAVAAGLVLRMAAGLFKLYRLSQQHEKISLADGVQLVNITGLEAPFSFGRNIYGDARFLQAPEQTAMLLHEKAHIRLGHTFDKIGMELLCALCWFNPVFWLAKRELALIHEFQADEAAVLEVPATTYAHTLLQQATPMPVTLAHHFFHHPLKRRIFMVYQQKTGKSWRKLVLLGSFSGIIAFTVLLQSGVEGNAQSKEKDNQKAGISAFQSAEYAKWRAERVYKEAGILAYQSASTDQPTASGGDFPDSAGSVAPQFPGGNGALMQFLASNLVYPAEARDKKIEGQVMMQFIVGKDGKPRDFKVVRAVNPLLDAEATRVLEKMPNWEPGKENGKTVDVSYNLPIRFKLEEDKKKPSGK